MSQQSDHQLSRRDFLIKTTGVLAGAAVASSLPSSLQAASSASSAAATQPAEPYVGPDVLAPRKLGRSGIIVPACGYGSIATPSPHVAAAALDRDFFFVHSAPGYTEGQAYKAIREALGDQKRRKNLVIALKISPKDVNKALDFFELEHIDIIVPPGYRLSDVTRPGFVDGLVKARESGKVRAIGWACHSDTVGTLNFAAREGVFDVALIGYRTDTPEFLRALEAAKEKGLGVFAMKYCPSGLRDMARLRTRLEWVLTEGLADCALVSFSDVSQVGEVIKFKLGKAGPLRSAMHRMDRVAALRQCSWCGACAGDDGRCPSGVAIPQIMRYDFYFTGQGAAGRARSKYACLPASSAVGACRDCGACERACPRRLPVREMLAGAHRRLA
jgi:predicted aldo/keto reductase-like oxidoreductase